MSVSDFDPRYIDIWKDSGTKRVVIPMPSVDAAVNLRQRLYRLRSAMKKEGHAMYETARRAVASIRISYSDKVMLFSNKKSTPLPADTYKVDLVVQPEGDIYNEALAEAGYRLPESLPSLE